MRLPNLPRSKRARVIALGGVATILILVGLLSSEFSGDTQSADPMAGVTVAQEPTPQPETTPGQSQLILELFNPSDPSLTNQITLTTVSQQIEQALTVSYVLTRCQLISQDDYTETFRALIVYVQEMKIVDDPIKAEALVRHIAESAGTSYSLVYGRMSCHDAQLPPLAEKLSRWTQAVMDRSRQ